MADPKQKSKYTLAQIDALLAVVNAGVAPAGYGLGTLPKRVTNYDEVKVNGWYYNTDGSVQGAPTAYTWACHVVTYSSNVIFQDFYGVSSAAFGGFIHARRCYHPTVYPNWSPVEWENPPMRLGVEYRTMERYLGKPVYRKLLDFGALPNGVNKTVLHNIPDVDIMIESIATAEVGSESLTVNGYRDILGCYATGNSVAIQASADMSSWTSCHVLLKYTKTTD